MDIFKIMMFAFVGMCLTIAFGESRAEGRYKVTVSDFSGVAFYSACSYSAEFTDFSSVVKLRYSNGSVAYIPIFNKVVSIKRENCGKEHGFK